MYNMEIKRRNPNGRPKLTWRQDLKLTDVEGAEDRAY